MLRMGMAMVLSGALALSACATDPYGGGPRDPNGKVIGAGAGAVAGAAIGAAVGRQKRGRNAAIGAGAGALAGLAVGAYMDQQEKKLRERLASSGGVAVVRQGDDIVVRVPNDLTFDVNQTTLKPAVRESLSAIARTLVEYPETRVEVYGHADSTGSDSYNLDLSQRRAGVVADYLRGEGVAPGRLASIGRGEREPIASNETEEGRERNRRVEIKLVPLSS